MKLFRSHTILYFQMLNFTLGFPWGFSRHIFDLISLCVDLQNLHCTHFLSQARIAISFSLQGNNSRFDIVLKFGKGLSVSKFVLLVPWRHNTPSLACLNFMRVFFSRSKIAIWWDTAPIITSCSASQCDFTTWWCTIKHGIVAICHYLCDALNAALFQSGQKSQSGGWKAFLCVHKPL